MQDNINEPVGPNAPIEPQAEPQAPTESEAPVEPQAPAGPMPDSPQAPTEKKPIGLIILAAIEAVVIIGLAIGLIFALNSGSSNTKCDATTASNTNNNNDKDDDDDDDGGDGGAGTMSKQEQRDELRKDDMSRILTAVNQYQANNNGALPFTDRSTGVWNPNENFVKRYIDDTCNASMTPTCSGTEFKDPDGNNYAFYYKGTGDFTKVVPSATVDHKIYVVLQSKCGDEDNTSEAAMGKREVSFYYRLENGSVICQDNQ